MNHTQDRPTRFKRTTVAVGALALAVLGTGISAVTSPALPAAQAYVGTPGAFSEYFNTKLHGGLVQAGNTVAYRDSKNVDNKALAEFVPDHEELSKTFSAELERPGQPTFRANSNGDAPWIGGKQYPNRVSGGNFAANASGLHNSSSAGVKVPAGASVKKAVLIWNGCDTGCEDPKGAFGEPNGTLDKSLTPGAVKLRAPGGAWTSVKADSVQRVGTRKEAFTALADVTALVKGSGTYSVGDIAMRDGVYNGWGSWHLMMTYELASEPLRQVVINTGTASIGEGSPTSIKLPAMDFPKSGQFAPKVFVGASDGDPQAGSTSFGGDYFQINGQDISQAPSRVSDGSDAAKSNFFTSLITDGAGQTVTDRTPAWPNTYGLDIVELSSPAGITRDTKGITLTGGSTGEGVHPYVFAIQTEVLPPKLKITKDDGRKEVLPGDTLTYKVKVTNTGEGEEPAATVKDTLPAQLTFVSASDKGALKDGVVQWPDFALAPGAEKVFTVTAKVNADVPRPGQFTNLATVAGYGDTDPTCKEAADADDRCATDTDTVPGADVKILKEHVSGTVVKGETLIWKVTVANEGKADARQVIVTDKLPKSVDPATLTGSKATQGKFEGGKWNVGTLKAGTRASIELRATAIETVPAGTDAGVNTARVTTPDEPTPPNPATCQDNTTVGADTDNCDTVPLPGNSSDLSLTKDDGLQVVTPGQELTYKIKVTNHAKADEPSATITDQLPEQLSFVKASDAGVYNAKTKTVTFKKLAIAAGKTRTVTVTATVNADVPRPGQFTNLATVAGTGEKPKDPGSCTEGDKRCASDTDKTTPEPPNPVQPSEPAEPTVPETPLAHTGADTGIIIGGGVGVLALVGGGLALALARTRRKEAAEQQN